MGTQKNRLNETVLLSIQNICLDCWVKNYDNFTLKFLLTGSMCYFTGVTVSSLFISVYHTEESKLLGNQYNRSNGKVYQTPKGKCDARNQGKHSRVKFTQVKM